MPQDRECKFKFPKSEQTNTKIIYTKASKLDGEYFMTSELKRNPASARINQHNISYLMSARANVDMKIMYDTYLCLVYVTKYCTKTESKS